MFKSILLLSLNLQKVFGSNCEYTYLTEIEKNIIRQMNCSTKDQTYLEILRPSCIIGEKVMKKLISHAKLFLK
jgi:hypothetical protein